MPRPRLPLLFAALVTLSVVPCAADLTADLDALVGAADLRYAQVGVQVVDADSGATVYSHDADTRVNPASNQKLITTAAAYDLLGPDFVYQTSVKADAAPDAGGLVKGNLYLRGSGDPSLTHGDLDRLAEKLKQAGVRRVSGSLVADTGGFSDDALGAGWSHDYLNAYYAAEVSALTVDGGCVTVIVRGADAPGKAPLLRLEPYSDFLVLAPDAVTAAGDATPGIYRHLGRNMVGLTGPIGVGRRVERRITVRQPGLHAATLLLLALKRLDITVADGVRGGRTSEGAVELACHTSQPLARLVTTINKHSDNNYAEALQRTISLVKTGNGSCHGSVALIDKWAEGFGADSKAFLMYDGSGLSRLNSVTPQFLVQVLRHMRAKSGWVDSLPVMGKDGTLGRRLKGTAAEGKVRAKTGYISGTRALSGYVHCKSGRRLAFSILVGNALGTDAANKLQNAACLRLVSM